MTLMAASTLIIVVLAILGDFHQNMELDAAIQEPGLPELMTSKDNMTDLTDKELDASIPESVLTKLMASNERLTDLTDKVIEYIHALDRKTTQMLSHSCDKEFDVSSLLPVLATMKENHQREVADLNEKLEKINTTVEENHRTYVTDLPSKDLTCEKRISELEDKRADKDFIVGKRLKTMKYEIRDHSLQISGLTDKDVIADKKLISMQEEIGHNSLQISGLSEKVSYAISFAATISNEGMHPTKHQVVVLSEVIHQNGTDYDATTGIFTASIPGLYSFSMSLACNHNKFLDIDIQVNDKALARVRAGDRFYWDQSHMTATTPLAVGDTVKLVVYSVYGGTIMSGTPWTVFSGFLVRPY